MGDGRPTYNRVLTSGSVGMGIPMGIQMGIPVGMGWVWGLKCHPHGSPGDMAKKMQEFESKRSKIQHIILNYMKQFETILHFVRGPRDLQLHLESIQSLMKYFFCS